jgi:hypothetical protein
MLRRIAIVAVGAAMLVVPAAVGAHASSGSFTVPSASSAVTGSGSYQVLSAHKVKVMICAKETGSAAAVGATAIVYNASRSRHATVSAVVTPATPGLQACGTKDLGYTAHLKVYSFIGGSSGKVLKKSKRQSVY